MDAIVLAGGYATRLWPITKHRPKMLLPVGKTTVIDRILVELEADNRIDEVYISTNARFADDLQSHLSDSGFEKPVLSIEETMGEDEKFGVIGALAQLIARESIDDDLLVIAGDNFIDFDVGEFVDFFYQKRTACIAAYDVGSIDRAKSYGVVVLDDNQLIDFQEKPEEPKNTLISTGCYVFPSAVISRFSEYLAEGNNPDEPGWFIQWLYQRSPIHAFEFDEAWFDIGTPESYLDAVAWTLEGGKLVSESAEVKNSTLGNNVHVMEDAEIVDSNIDNSVIFAETRIIDCNFRRCIIDENAHLENLDLAGALLGAHTSLTQGG